MSNDIELDDDNLPEPVQTNEYLEMSDEDFLNTPTPTAAPVVAADPVVPDVVDDGEAEAEAAAPVVPEPVAATPAPVAKGGKPESDPAAAEPEVKVDFEAEYKKLTAPFRANGKDMQIGNVDDAIRLMQLGANYNKKMAGLKPALRVAKLLEKNDLLDENKLAFLIEVSKNNPAAISKLLADAKIDPLDLDIEKSTEYKQPKHAVDDRELELDNVLEEIKDSPHYNQTLDVVSTQWDANSRKTVANNPQLLKVVNDHMASGVYDLINTEVDRRKVLGTLKGLSDLDAYKSIGDELNAKGAFDHLFAPKPGAKAPVAKAAPVVDNSKRNDKRRAAGSPTAESPNKPAGDFNPLALSDEDFMKQVAPQYL